MLSWASICQHEICIIKPNWSLSWNVKPFPFRRQMFIFILIFFWINRINILFKGCKINSVFFVVIFELFLKFCYIFETTQTSTKTWTFPEPPADSDWVFSDVLELQMFRWVFQGVKKKKELSQFNLFFTSS